MAAQCFKTFIESTVPNGVHYSNILVLRQLEEAAVKKSLEISREQTHLEDFSKQTLFVIHHQKYICRYINFQINRAYASKLTFGLTNFGNNEYHSLHWTSTVYFNRQLLFTIKCKSSGTYRESRLFVDGKKE